MLLSLWFVPGRFLRPEYMCELLLNVLEWRRAFLKVGTPLRVAGFRGAFPNSPPFPSPSLPPRVSPLRPDNVASASSNSSAEGEGGGWGGYGQVVVVCELSKEAEPMLASREQKHGKAYRWRRISVKMDRTASTAVKISRGGLPSLMPSCRRSYHTKE